MSERSAVARQALSDLEQLAQLDRFFPRGPGQDEIMNRERLRLMKIIAEEELGWAEPADPYVYAKPEVGE